MPVTELVLCLLVVASFMSELAPSRMKGSPKPVENEMLSIGVLFL